MSECAECGAAVHVPEGHEFGPEDKCCTCLDREATRLRHGLDELVKLQAHYAKQLNIYDQGERHRFKDANEWLARLDELATK